VKHYLLKNVRKQIMTLILYYSEHILSK